MKRKHLILLLAGILVLAGASCTYVLFGLGHSSGGGVASYVATLQGLNHDMRETLHKVREDHDTENNIELFHDQLHLMKKILHLVDKEEREEEHFITLHDLNHEMRDTWHAVKKDRDREANLEKLHDQLHDMKETLAPLMGEPKEPL